MQLLLPHLRLVHIFFQHQYRICCQQISGATNQGNRREARQVMRFFSNVAMPFRTRSTMTCLECWNAASRPWSQAKCESCLTRSRKGSMTGPSEYAQATWLTSPNHDLASASVFGTGKFSIASSMGLEGVTPEDVIWSPPNSTMSWQNWNLSLLSTIPFWHSVVRSQRCDRRILRCWDRRAGCRPRF